MIFENTPLVTILMATYNGDSYLSEQIRSIISQSYSNWELIIRDDGSTDNTITVVNEFLHDQRINLLKFGNDHGSACINFSNLLEWAKSQSKHYVMFADQDDIWYKDKIEKSITFITNLESDYPGKPLLCYSKFQLITEAGNNIHKQISLPENLQMTNLFVENYAWGCTTIINNCLLKSIYKIPYQAVNHDYWIALVGAAFGRVVLLDEMLLRYRQHNNNVSGNITNSFWKNRYKRYFSKNDIMIDHFAANLSTTILFSKFYKDQFNKSQKLIIKEYIGNYRSFNIFLIITMLKNKIFKFGIFKNLTMFLFIFLNATRIYKKALQKML